MQECMRTLLQADAKLPAATLYYYNSDSPIVEGTQTPNPNFSCPPDCVRLNACVGLRVWYA
jgi:hypothetical protein